MANLEGLGEFDSHFKSAFTQLTALSTKHATEQGVWSGKQHEQFTQLLAAAIAMNNALSALVHHNR